MAGLPVVVLGGRAPKGPAVGSAHGAVRTQHPSLLLRATTQPLVLLSVTKMASHPPTTSVLQMREETPQHSLAVVLHRSTRGKDLNSARRHS